MYEARTIEEFGRAFGEYSTTGGKVWYSARSNTYRLKDIAGYLRECMDEPQGDTLVEFEIDGDGTLHVSTRRTDEPGEIETSDFEAVERR